MSMAVLKIENVLLLRSLFLKNQFLTMLWIKSESSRQLCNYFLSQRPDRGTKSFTYLSPYIVNIKINFSSEFLSARKVTTWHAGDTTKPTVFDTAEAIHTFGTNKDVSETTQWCSNLTSHRFSFESPVEPIVGKLLFIKEHLYMISQAIQNKFYIASSGYCALPSGWSTGVLAQFRQVCRRALDGK